MADVSHDLQISIEPYRKIVIHEVIQLGFHDFVDQILNQTRAVGGGAIPVLSWCDGIVFQISSFNPNSEEIIRESLRGTIHYSAVTFALKPNFEREVIRPGGTVRLVNQAANPNFATLCEVLKRNARLADPQPASGGSGRNNA